MVSVNLDLNMIVPLSVSKREIGAGRAKRVDGYSDEGPGKGVKIELLEFVSGLDEYPTFLEGENSRSHFLLKHEGRLVAEFSLRKGGEEIGEVKAIRNKNGLMNPSTLVAIFLDYTRDSEPVAVTFCDREIGVFRPVLSADGQKLEV